MRQLKLLESAISTNNHDEIVSQSFKVLRALHDMKRGRERITTSDLESLEVFVKKNANVGLTMMNSNNTETLVGNPLLIIGIVGLIINLIRLIIEYKKQKGDNVNS